MPRSATARVYSVPPHGRGSRHAVQLEVQAAGVADHLPAGVAPPDCGGVGAAVAARQFHARRRAAGTCAARR